MAQRFSITRTRLAAVLAIALSTTTLPRPAAAEPVTATSSTVSIKNFGRINDQFFRGAQPKGRDFKDLAALGVKTVIDLSGGNLKAEPTLVQQAGMKFVSLPMVTTTTPQAEVVKKFLEIVNDPANQPVFVHCVGGRHRTGVMTAAYRLTHDGWNADRAYDEMVKFDFKGGWVNHTALKSFVYDFYSDGARKPSDGILATTTVLPQE